MKYNKTVETPEVLYGMTRIHLTIELIFFLNSRL